jgi:hypothetical protein
MHSEAPARLTELEEEIDRVVQGEQWTGTSR